MFILVSYVGEKSRLELFSYFPVPCCHCYMCLKRNSYVRFKIYPNLFMNWVGNIRKSWRNKLQKQIHKETNDSFCVVYLRCYTFAVDLEPHLRVLGGYKFGLKFLIVSKYTYLDNSTLIL